MVWLPLSARAAAARRSRRQQEAGPAPLPRGAADGTPADGRKRAIGTRRPIEAALTPNQRWSLDFVPDQLTDGRRFRILAVVTPFRSLPHARAVLEIWRRDYNGFRLSKAR